MNSRPGRCRTPDAARRRGRLRRAPCGAAPCSATAAPRPSAPVSALPSRGGGARHRHGKALDLSRVKCSPHPSLTRQREGRIRPGPFAGKALPRVSPVVTGTDFSVGRRDCGASAADTRGHCPAVHRRAGLTDGIPRRLVIRNRDSPCRPRRLARGRPTLPLSNGRRPGITTYPGARFHLVVQYMHRPGGLGCDGFRQQWPVHDGSSSGCRERFQPIGAPRKISLTRPGSDVRKSDGKSAASGSGGREVGGHFLGGRVRGLPVFTAGSRMNVQLNHFGAGFSVVSRCGRRTRRRA